MNTKISLLKLSFLAMTVCAFTAFADWNSTLTNYTQATWVVGVQGSNGTVTFGVPANQCTIIQGTQAYGPCYISGATVNQNGTITPAVVTITWSEDTGQVSGVMFLTTNGHYPDLYPQYYTYVATFGDHGFDMNPPFSQDRLISYSGFNITIGQPASHATKKLQGAK